ncbi:MFS transporter, partial [bacterium]
LLRILGGIFFAIIGPFSLALSSFAVPAERRDSAVATYTSYVAIGLMMGPAIGTLSVASFGTRSTFYTASLLALVGFMFAIVGARVVDVEGREKAAGLSSLRNAISNRFFAMCFLAVFCFSFQVTVVTAYAPLYARQGFAMDDAVVSAMFFAYSTFLVAMRLSMGRLSRRVRRRTILTLGLFNSAMMVLSLSLSPSVGLFILSYSLLGLSHGIVPPSAALIITGSIEPSELVAANSIYFNSWDLGAMVGPYVMATVAEGSGLGQALALTSIPSLFGILPIVALSGSKWREVFSRPKSSD